ncbi:glycosyl hydrolases family 2, sugar binding domain-containing protein [Hirsutella rhossiliensis]|uniref:Glycosyl hydrolases family 2, sugar binding domain-containing protein n=1 Tax=Hirsutella rhossiliensis TaxID=111463 RepID=A0A9P8MU73_9HYPO|nr:glycosyl hydrolases family 2, sugar binding domain-containing protein [Hirsutella rhossiliensis]KAH0961147.1 glycosyl hydrolases family 2, sugar binding domain-containing protein [Hirsutella rhossiliensis]
MQLLHAVLWSSLFWLSVAAGSLQSVFKRAPVPYRVQTPPLDTDWTYKVGRDPWPEHPRPQLRRDVWQNLNGIWTYQEARSAADIDKLPGGLLEREVLVPSCIESGLSGIQLLNVTRMWFARSFRVSKEWEGKSVTLHFEAVDYDATVFVNGVKVGNHVGGYFRFSLDVTAQVKFDEDNELLVFVYDPSDSEVIPVGKQTKNPRHIWYRPCSGIWQTVWLESVPRDHIQQLDVAAGMDGIVTLTAHSSRRGGNPIEVSIYNRKGHVVARRRGNADTELQFEVDNPELWEPSSPTLYNMTIKMGEDEVQSYTGFRTISKGLVNGIQRPLLNGDFVFLFGTLDQGYWPDGLYTPPSREAMIYDLKMLKSLGFNMVRKHIKVEPDLFYQACDEIGLMVVQDMPSLPDDFNRLPNDAQQKEFQRQLEVLISEHKSYPSIVTWVIYNEGWGQRRNAPYPEGQLTDVVRSIDPTRLIDSVTGWFDHGFGDFSDNHHYANPQCGTPFYSIASSPYDPTRIGFQGEFGGIGHNVSADHLWKVQQAIDTINQTYEVSKDLNAYNYRASVIFMELREQVERYACSGGVWTQTTDVEGEVNGLYTYDRRLLRPDVQQWKDDIALLYRAALARGVR